jgi:MFS transporter, DHA1 family, inner membrane transport protein
MPNATAPSALVKNENAALWALMLGNFVIGTGALVPAGMANSLIAAFAATPTDVGHLTTYGAVILCIGAPLWAFVTNAMDRRFLLAATLAVYAVGHLASAFVSSLEALLVIRILMISSAAIFTPQAAGTASLFIPPERRAAAVTFVFLGWSLAAAFGMPLMGLFGARLGWQVSFWVMALASAASLALLWVSLPAGLKIAPMSVEAWRKVLVHPAILLVLAVTALQLVGQFALFPYLAPELKRQTAVSPELIALAMGVYGMTGAIGSAIATRYVGQIGPANGLMICLGVITVGLAMWALLSGGYALAVVSLAVWGLGFSAGNALQQSRLIAIDPPSASASVALNTSAIYVGQAIGAALGGQIVAAGTPGLLGWAGAMFVILAMAVSFVAQTRFKA